MATCTLVDLPDEAAFDSHIQTLPSQALLVLSFHAPWAAPCAQMRTLLSTLAATYPATDPPRVSFVAVDAEALPDVSETYDVSAVPFLALQRGGSVLERLSGCDAAKVRAAVERHVPASSSSSANTKDATATALPPRLEPDADVVKAKQERESATADRETATNGTPSKSAETSQEDLNKRLETLVKAAPVMLFMKGTPSAPQCGFSRQLVGLLRSKGVRYGFFNILADEDVRQGLKTWADWPTFPQLWMDGELVGGLDIVKEEAENNPDFFDKYVASKPAAPAVDAPAAKAQAAA